MEFLKFVFFSDFVSPEDRITNRTTEIGLTLQYVLSLSSLVLSLIFSFGTFMTEASIVERLKENCDFTESEGELSLPLDEMITDKWPQYGAVCFDNVSVRYRKGLPFAIKNFDLTIEPGEKVVIVGRTGSGKSTLLLALMRILELEKTDTETSLDKKRNKKKGEILIDGVDIARLGLHKLRRNIAVIPQDPYLLEGTLRFNLDQFGEYSDSQMIKILERIEFLSTIKDKKHTVKTEGSEKKNENYLDMKIEGRGANLGVGQRQLICIARALLKRTRILLMNEATENVEKKVDRLIQRIVLGELERCTVITVAHRIETVMGYERVVVLDQGSKVEEGRLLELISDEGSQFYHMVKAHE